MTLGIPSNVVMAILLGAMMIHGLQPGPSLVASHPDVFWGVITSMYIGNAMLLVLNLPMIGLWVQMLRIPYGDPLSAHPPFLPDRRVQHCLFGFRHPGHDIFGVLGYLMKKTDYEAAPLVLALVLEGLFEDTLRQSLLLSDGKFLIFFQRPISAVFICLAIFLLLFPLLPGLKKKRPAVGLEAQD